MRLPSSRLFAVLSLGLLLPVGCGKFFVDPNGVGGTSTCSTNCIYIANSGTDDVAAFAATNPLSVVSSVNASFGEIPTAMAVSPNNAYLYVASASGAEISLFNIQDGGSLGTETPEVTAITPYALAVDTTSTYLLAAGLAVSSSCTSGLQVGLYVYTIGTDGAITNTSVTPAGGPCGSTTAGYPLGIAVSPSDGYIFVAAGTNGIVGYTFSGGVATPEAYLSCTVGGTGCALTGDTSVSGVVVDPNSAYVFASATGSPDGGVAQFGIPVTTAPALTLKGAIQDLGGAFAAITTSSSYVYATALNTGQVYGFSYTSGGLTALSGSPYSPSVGSSGTVGIAATSGFVFTINSDSGGNLQEFTVGSGGVLNAIGTGSTSSGTYAPVALAVTQ
jgi:DNA-binding beta-propeller fold protein YncE